MKIKFAIFNGKILSVEVIVMGNGNINIKVIEPIGIFIKSEEFDKKLIFNSRAEAEKYLSNG